MKLLSGGFRQRRAHSFSFQIPFFMTGHQFQFYNLRPRGQVNELPETDWYEFHKYPRTAVSTYSKYTPSTGERPGPTRNARVPWAYPEAP